MGAKLFKSLLLYEGEYINRPFLDILNRLEKQLTLLMWTNGLRCESYEMKSRMIVKVMMKRR